MKKIIGLTFAGILLYSQLTFAQEHCEKEASLIHTESVAEVSGENDSMNISVSVITEAKSLDEASAENADKTNAVLGAINKLNIKNLSLKTANFRVNPKRDFKARPPKIVGYEVQNAVEIKMEKFEPKHLSEFSSRIIGAALENGANNIDFIQSYIKDTDALENEALTIATQKAKARADIVAKAAGVKIKKITSISTQTDSGMPMPKMMRSAVMMDESDSGGAPPIEIGKSTIRMQVTMTVEIE